MARIVEMHPTHPQGRRIALAVAAMRAGGLVGGMHFDDAGHRCIVASAGGAC